MIASGMTPLNCWKRLFLQSFLWICHRRCTTAMSLLRFWARKAGYEMATLHGAWVWQWQYDISSLVTIVLGLLVTSVCCAHGFESLGSRKQWFGQKAYWAEVTKIQATKSFCVMEQLVRIILESWWWSRFSLWLKGIGLGTSYLPSFSWWPAKQKNCLVPLHLKILMDAQIGLNKQSLGQKTKIMF